LFKTGQSVVRQQARFIRDRSNVSYKSQFSSVRALLTNPQPLIKKSHLKKFRWLYL